MTTTPVTSSPPAADPAPAGSPRMGIVVGSAIVWSLRFATTLGAQNARMEIAIQTPTSQIDPIIDAYARAGVRPQLLAGFPGRIPSDSDVANLATWAKRYGPGGSFWVGKSYPASVAVDRIEFGNESSGPWQYQSLNGVSDWPNSPAYAAIAEGYGRTYRDAVVAVRDANPAVKVLAVGDVAGRERSWMDGMFRAVPDLGDYVQGWVVHPYGTDWQRNVDDVLAQAKSHGAPDTVPLYATEVGVATDDGNCLTQNFGYNRCMSYDSAATTMTQQIAAMKQRYGSRLEGIDFYSCADLSSHSETSDSERYFGALKNDGSAKGSYTGAIKSMLAAA